MIAILNEKKKQKEVEVVGATCVLQGTAITPEMAGICRQCHLYLHTCLPIVMNGFLVGAECNNSYCEFYSYYEKCGQ